MWMTELATNTSTADKRIGSHSDIRETIATSSGTTAWSTAAAAAAPDLAGDCPWFGGRSQDRFQTARRTARLGVPPFHAQAGGHPEGDQERRHSGQKRPGDQGDEHPRSIARG